MNIGTRTRIVIVDDHPIIRSFLRELLTPQADIEICAETGSVTEARALIGTHHPDIAIIDVMLEDGNGLALIKDLLNRAEDQVPTTRYLVFSAQRDSLAARRSAEAGAAGFVGKQAEVADLLEAIRTIRKGGTYFEASLLLPKTNGCQSIPGAELLTARELEVYEFIGEGVGTSEIAKRLFLSVKTIETHREKIKNKLQLNSGNELQRHAMQWALGLEERKV